MRGWARTTTSRYYVCTVAFILLLYSQFLVASALLLGTAFCLALSLQPSKYPGAWKKPLLVPVHCLCLWCASCQCSQCHIHWQPCLEVLLTVRGVVWTWFNYKKIMEVDTGHRHCWHLRLGIRDARMLLDRGWFWKQTSLVRRGSVGLPTWEMSILGVNKNIKQSVRVLFQETGLLMNYGNKTLVGQKQYLRKLVFPRLTDMWGWSLMLVSG